jgi:hypothetical protein
MNTRFKKSVTHSAELRGLWTVSSPIQLICRWVVWRTIRFARMELANFQGWRCPYAVEGFRDELHPHAASTKARSTPTSRVWALRARGTKAVTTAFSWTSSRISSLSRFREMLDKCQEQSVWLGDGNQRLHWLSTEYFGCRRARGR